LKIGGKMADNVRLVVWIAAFIVVLLWLAVLGFGAAYLLR
jgi:hypothetical protein